MGRFFTDWALWEKLVFVLACAIVVTILLGCAKLGHTHWKLRKYAAVAEEKQRRGQGMLRQMSQRRRASASEGADVPFGIRAIESGIEVDGVWISRTNTPEPASGAHSASSSVWEHIPRKEYDAENLEMHQYHGRSTSNSTTGTARPGSSTFERATTTHRVAGSNTSQDASPTDPSGKHPNNRHYPPSSLSKFSTTPYLLRPDSTSSTLQGIEAVFPAAGPMQNSHGAAEGCSAGSNESSSQSTYDSGNTEPISASAPKLLSQQTRSRKQSANLDLMHSHRISQAAETGQIAPRARRPDQSGEWDTAANGHQFSSEPGSYAQPQPNPSTSMENGLPTGLYAIDPFMTPKIEALPDAVRRSSLPDVTPFAKFCQTAPPSPHPGSSRPSSSPSFPFPHSKVDVTGPSPASLATVDDAVLADSTCVPETQQPTPSQPKPGSFEHRKSDVLRGHGTGFEILRPGSLKSSLPDHTMANRSGPPISLHNGSTRQRSSSADSRKKLQKKRQPSVDSQRSVDAMRGHPISMA